MPKTLSRNFGRDTNINQPEKNMNKKRTAGLMLITSIAFAAAIILASNVLQDHSSADNVTWTLVAIWFIPMALLIEQVSQDNDSK